MTRPLADYLVGYQDSWSADPRAANLQWFREAEMGLFLHFSPASILPGGKQECPIERTRLTDWDLLVSGGTDNTDFVQVIPEPFLLFAAPGVNNGPTLPAAIFIRHARAIALQDIRVRWADDLGAVWQRAIQLDDVNDAQLREIDAPDPHI